jgi:hypothetical protein
VRALTRHATVRIRVSRFIHSETTMKLFGFSLLMLFQFTPGSLAAQSSMTLERRGDPLEVVGHVVRAVVTMRPKRLEAVP